MLKLFLEYPGEILTRDRIRNQLWPNGTAVEFDQSIKTAVKKLRSALRDSVEEPRYIETVGRRGYRWKSPITWEDGQALLNRSAGDPSHEVDASKTAENSRSATTAGRGRRSVAPWLLGLIGCVLLGVIWWRRTNADRPRSVSLTQFTAFPGEKYQPAFSPDGKRLAFVWDGNDQSNNDIYIKAVDGGTPIRLTSNSSPDLDPTWSPDGQQIAFRRIYETTTDILIAPAAGGAERRLAQVQNSGFVSSRARGLSWSSNGKFLVTVDSDSPATDRIISISAATGQKRTLTTPDVNFGDYRPAVSPDSQAIAFIRYPNPPDNRYHIYIQNVSGSGVPLGPPRRMTDNLQSVSDVKWGPAGRSLFFSNTGNHLDGSDTYITRKLWRISVSGGSPEPLDSVGSPVLSFSIASKGQRLAYERDPGGDHNIYELGLRGGNHQIVLPRLFLSSTESDYSARFSPDGKQIALVSARSGPLEIWVCASDGSDCGPITSFGGPEVGSPAWSPDGNQLAFDTIKNGQWDIYVADVKNRTTRRLTYEGSSESRPSWSTDGRWIYFASNRSGVWQIWKASSTGGTAVQVTKNGGFEANESADGKYVYYAKRMHKGLWRKPVHGEQEVQIFDQGAEGEWCLSASGIYLLSREPAHGLQIRFSRFGTTKLSLVFALPPGVAGTRYNIAIPSLTVSPDGNRALYTQLDHSEHDIVMVENFRVD